MTEIKTVVVRGKKKNIEVKDGLVLIICGHEKDSGAFWKELEKCSDGELAAVEAVEETTQTENNIPAAADTPTPWCDNSLDDGTEEEYHNTFYTAVDYLTSCKAEDFVELVTWAKAHNNTFWHCVSEVANVVNADDAYCSVIIKLTRHLGKDLEKLAFKKLNELFKGNVEEFIEFFNALKVINS